MLQEDYWGVATMNASLNHVLLLRNDGYRQRRKRKAIVPSC